MVFWGPRLVCSKECFSYSPAGLLLQKLWEQALGLSIAAFGVWTPQELPILWSKILNIAVAPYTSHVHQDDGLIFSQAYLLRSLGLNVVEKSWLFLHVSSLFLQLSWYLSITAVLTRCTLGTESWQYETCRQEHGHF